MNPRPAIKSSLLDKADRLSTRLKELNEQVEALKKSCKEHKISPSVIMQVNNSFADRAWRELLTTLPRIEEAFYELLNLISSKYQLKEDAQTRFVRLFKTSNVKKQIDEMVPDETLAEISKKLARIYEYIKNFESIATQFYRTWTDDGSRIHITSIQLDHAKVEELLGKEKINIEYESINTMVSDLIEMRQQVITMLDNILGEKGEFSTYLKR